MARERTKVLKRKYVYSKKCRFCRMKMDDVDYKDLSNIQKLVAAQGKVLSRKRTGTCATHQRSVKSAVKRARYLALLPYVG
ncbi:MAG: 30S ribosomal protein S18 [Candidatus Brocadiales bacterium]